MHLFIYDSFLTQKTYEKTVLKIEGAIPSLHLEAKSVRLSFLKDVREVVPDSMKRGYSTFICVGNDQTVSKVLNAMPTFEDITLGVIPIQGEGTNLIASSLGIDSIDHALEYIQKRIITKLDVGKVNMHYFLSQITFQESNLEVWCEDKFAFKSNKEGGTICLHNISSQYAQDGLLELSVEGASSPGIMGKLGSIFGSKHDSDNGTRIPVRTVRISAEKKDNLISMADQKVILKNPATVHVLPRVLRVIVGKNLFS